VSERSDDRIRQGERLVLADRVHRYNAPLDLMFKALTEGRGWWLGLQPGEIEPQVLVAVPPERVVWSSLWPASPDDTIEFDVSGDSVSTEIRFRWFTNSPPDERGIGITRQRLNRELGGNIRAVVSEHYWNPGVCPRPRPDTRSG
jgi:hypothetical protein